MGRGAEGLTHAVVACRTSIPRAKVGHKVTGYRNESLFSDLSTFNANMF